MATREATNQLEVVMFGPGVRADCTQCGKPAAAYLETEQGRSKLCLDHVRLALLHFSRAHGIS